MEMLARELSMSIGFPLQPDPLDAIFLTYKNGVQVQIEFNSAKQHLVIASDLGPIGKGRYQNTLFKQALKFNGQPLPQEGTLAYSRKKEALILQHFIPIEELKEGKVAEFLPLFTEKAFAWKEALQRGEVPPLAKKSQQKMFGL
jgi:hypothetical protein